MSKPLVVAHRGDTEFAPENTLAAFSSAIEKGTDVIEFDVHFTRDKELVVHHDYYLGRTEKGNGFIGDYSLRELRALDVGVWFGIEFKGEKMPTLRDVLDIGKGRVRFEVELRCPTASFLEKVMDVINECGVGDDVEITSPHIPLLQYAGNINLGVRKGVFFDVFPEWKGASLGQQHIIDWMQLIDAQVVHLPYSLLERDFIERLHKHDFIVHGSNLTNVQEMQLAMEKGIEQFSTNRLAIAIEIRDMTIDET